MSKNTKKPWIAASLNLIPGLGYLYLRKRQTLAVLLIAGNSIGIIAALFNPLLTDYYTAPFNKWDWLALLGLVFILGGFMWDAYQDANPLKHK